MGGMMIGGVYLFLTIWIIGFLVKFRTKITRMTGMMCAMALGMTMGIGMGTLLATWLPEQFFYSTIFAIWIGSGIGIMAGLPTSLLAVIDGLLSGLMGGMMGTMLMMMISAPYTDLTIKIIAVICTGVLFLIFLLLREEVVPFLKNNQQKILLYPGSMFLFIIISLGVIPLTEMDVNHSINHHKHQDIAKIIITASEYSFTPSSIQINAGQPIQLILNNTGKFKHDFEVIGADVHIHTTPGTTNSKFILLDKPGYYEVICKLPGHKEAGMTGLLHVS